MTCDYEGARLVGFDKRQPQMHSGTACACPPLPIAIDPGTGDEGIVRETKPQVPLGDPPGQPASAPSSVPSSAPQSAPKSARAKAPSDSARRQTSRPRDSLDGAHRGAPRSALSGAPRSARRPSSAQFDLLVTFDDDQPAREALLALRRERFGPHQAVLLTRGPLGADEFERAVDELRAESYLALSIVVATELAIGALLGGVIGWLVGLFRFGPVVGPVWQPILILGGIGLLSGAAVAAFDIRRWQRSHVPSPGVAAVALRLSGPDAGERLARAQQVLERLGGQREIG